MLLNMTKIDVDPRVTEQFLLNQEEVMDASVWLDRLGLHAHITPTPGTNVDTKKLMTVCAALIGVKQTPEDIQVFPLGQ